jgi:hypothetical protein
VFVKSEHALVILLLSLSEEMGDQIRAVDATAAAVRQLCAGSAAGAAVPAASLPAAAADEQHQRWQHLELSLSLLLARRQRLLGCWQQQAAAIFTVFESFVRAQQQLPRSVVTIIGRLVCQCSPEPPGRTGLLLLLARDGSSEQQVAFFNLLVSLLKLARTVELPAYSTQGALQIVGVALTAGRYLLTNGAASALLTNSAASEGSSGNSHASAPLWLLLLGRCFLLGAEALEQEEAQGRDLVQLLQQAQQLQQLGQTEDSVLLEELYQFVAGPRSLVRQLADAVLGIVGQGSSLGAELSAAGYDLGPIVQGGEALAACYPGIEELQAVPDAVEVSERVDGLIRVLVSVGNALSMFAVPHCCNNPSCSNTAGLTEAGIVSGKGCICAGCKVARYCGKPCQAAHWKPAHKPVCRILRARSAGMA